MFDIDTSNNIVIDEPVYLLVKEFQALWEADKTKTKSKVKKEFAYMYLKNNYKSSYRKAYSKEDLPKVLKRDLGFPNNWKENDLYIAAEKKYNDLQLTKSLKLLRAAETALDQIVLYFENFNLEEIDKSKKDEVVSKVMANLRVVDDVTAKISIATQRVMRETEERKLSGNKQLSSRELPPRKRGQKQ